MHAMGWASCFNAGLLFHLTVFYMTDPLAGAKGGMPVGDHDHGLIREVLVRGSKSLVFVFIYNISAEIKQGEGETFGIITKAFGGRNHELAISNRYRQEPVKTHEFSADPV